MKELEENSNYPKPDYPIINQIQKETSETVIAKIDASILYPGVREEIFYPYLEDIDFLHFYLALFLYRKNNQTDLLARKNRGICQKTLRLRCFTATC